MKRTILPISALPKRKEIAKINANKQQEIEK